MPHYAVTGDGTAETLTACDVLTVTVTGVISAPGSAVLMQGVRARSGTPERWLAPMAPPSWQGPAISIS